MNRKNLFGLTDFAQNRLSVALLVFVACLGIRIVRSPETALKVANVQLVTSSSAIELDRLAQELEVQTEIIKQKEAAYRELKTAYEDYINNRQGNVVLEEKIKAIDTLPPVENLDKIQVEIQETEDKLLEISADPLP